MQEYELVWGSDSVEIVFGDYYLANVVEELMQRKSSTTQMGQRKWNNGWDIILSLRLQFV